MRELNWDTCEKHFRGCMEEYGKLLNKPGVSVMPALMVIFQPLLKRFEEGERTEALYDEMMDVK